MPLRDDLLDPIPGDTPSGANLRYDPVTDKIKEARREDIDAPQGEWKTALKTADLPAVIKMASDALAKKGKDLQIAVWLVDAHVRKEGFGLLAPSFQLLQDLLDQYWDTLYPEIDEDGDMEVRAAPLVWLGTKLAEPLGFLPLVSGKLSWHKYQESRKVGYETDADTGEKEEARQSAIKEGKTTAEEFDAAAEATSIAALRETYKQLNDGKSALETLSTLCDEKFGDFSPSFIKTREAIEEIAQTVRIILSRRPGGLEAEPSETSIDDEFAVGLSADTETSSTEAVATAEEPVSQDSGGADIARQLAGICRQLRSRDPEDPSPYMMLRCFAWANIMYRAPLLDHSAIVPPSSELRVKLKRLTADSEWDKVLELTEATMLQPAGKFWLDLQRYAVNAIEQKGFPSVARVVNNQFRILLETMPDVLDITFADDTPAANQETKSWIENYVIIQKVTPPAPEGGDTSSSSDSSSSDFSFDTSSTDTSFSFDTPSTDTSSTDFSFDTPSTDTSSTDFSFDTPSTDTSSTPSFDATPAAPEPEPYTVEENPPILEAEEPPPADSSDEFVNALRAVRDGRAAEGLGMITSILATERSGRQRFRRRTQLAHLLMAAGKGKVAQPLLDEIVAEIEARRLEEWEPSEAIAYPLELLMHCLTSADDERRAQLYARICKLDPVRAVNCSV
jgi:type VI secretion system protein ImpA